MSATTALSFTEFLALIIIGLVLVPAFFFLLFYYYLSQLAGINDSLKAIVDLLADHWYPEDEKQKREVSKP